MANKKLPLTKRQKSYFYLIAISNVVNAIAVSLLAPFYPRVATTKGATATESGLVIGIFEFVVFIASPIFGSYIHEIGLRNMFLIGLIVCSVTTTIFSAFNFITNRTLFIGASIIIRSLAGIGNSANLTAAFSYIAQEFPEQIVSMFGRLELFFGMGMITGPPIGGLLYDVGGFGCPFLVVGCMLFITTAVDFAFLPKDKDTSNVEKTSNDTLKVYKIYGYLLAALSIAVAAFGIGFLQATLELHLRQFNLSGFYTGLTFVTSGLVYALGTPFVGMLCESPKIGPKYITIAGCVLAAIGFIIIGPAPFFGNVNNLYVTIAGLVVHGVGIAFVLVASFGDAYKEVIDNGIPNTIRTHGIISAMWASSFALGAFTGPIIAGILHDWVGFKNGTMVVVGVNVFMAVLNIIYLKRNPKSRTQSHLLQNESEAPATVVK